MAVRKIIGKLKENPGFYAPLIVRRYVELQRKRVNKRKISMEIGVRQ